MKKEDEKKEFSLSLELIAKSSLVVFIGFAFAKIFTYVYRIIIAREFGVEAYGLFSLGIMVIGWAAVLAVFGLNDGLLRYISIFRGKKKQAEINYLFRRSFYLLFFAGLVGGTLLFLFSSFIANNIFHNSELTIFLKIFSIAIPIDTAIVAFLAPLRAYERVGWRIFITSILSGLLQVGFILLFIASGLGVISIPLSYVIALFIIFIASAIVLKKQVPMIFVKQNKKVKRGIFREVLSYSWPLIFAEVIWKIFKWTDSFLIGYFNSATDVGLYNAAIPIAFLLTFSSDLFMQMFVPLINKEYSKKNKEVVKQLSQQVGKWLFFTNLPLLILLFIFPADFINLFFGSEFVSAATSLRILTIGILFLSLGGISTRLLGMVGKSKKVLFNIMITAIINLVLNLILIPKYGITGAAISTSISFIILSLLFIFQAYREIKIIPFRRKNFNIMLAAVISLAVLLFVKDFIVINNLSLIVLSIFFGAFYTLLVFIFRGLDKNDMMILKSFLSRSKK